MLIDKRTTCTWEFDKRLLWIGVEWNVTGGERHLIFGFIGMCLHVVSYAPDVEAKVGDLVRLWPNSEYAEMGIGEVYEILEGIRQDNRKVYKVWFDDRKRLLLLDSHRMYRLQTQHEKLIEEMAARQETTAASLEDMEKED